MDAVAVVPALREDKLGPAPKEGEEAHLLRSVHISRGFEPGLNHAGIPTMIRYCRCHRIPSGRRRVVEACVANHIRRFFPTYYIKAQGEVDIAYVRDGRFWPVEIKWTNQLRPKSLKQIARYGNGEIWSKSRHSGEIEGVNVLPLPIELLRVGGDGCGAA